MTSSRTKAAQRQATAGAAQRRRRQLWLFAGALAVVSVAVVAVLALADGDDDTAREQASGGFTGGDFHSLVADPAVSGRLLVGGHQAVSASDDRGVSWQRLDALDDVDAMGWGFTPSATWISGHPGIVAFSDGGQTAQRRNDALPDTDIHALGAGEGVLYAAGPSVGILVSRDDAATWQTVTTADGSSFFGQILVDPANPDHLVAADAARGPVASDDGGQTWTVLADFPASWVSVADAFQRIYASSPEGAVMSQDGGASWTPMNLPPGASLVEADPHTVERLYAGVHDGAQVTVYTSDDQGASWRDS